MIFFYICEFLLAITAGNNSIRFVVQAYESGVSLPNCNAFEIYAFFHVNGYLLVFFS